jgi:hypothetical protein
MGRASKFSDEQKLEIALELLAGKGQWLMCETVRVSKWLSYSICIEYRIYI